MPYTKDLLTKQPLEAAAASAKMRERAKREAPGKDPQRVARAKRASTRLRLSETRPPLTPEWLVLSESFDLGTAHLIFDMQPIERASLVKAGAPSNLLSNLSESMDMPKIRLIKILGLSKSTVDRKIADKADFSMADSERILGLVKLVGQVEKIVMESGETKAFDAARWFGHWIEQPEAALAGQKPSDLMDSSDGREAVSRLLAQMQSGAYA